MSGSAQPRIIYDIETKGCDWSALSEAEQKYLAKRTQKSDDGRADAGAQTKLALWSLTAEIVAIGMFDPDRGRGKIHLWVPGSTSGSEDPTLKTATCRVITHTSEEDLLRTFWRTLPEYFQSITFNGRSFDGPMLAHRSIVHGVPVSRDLVGNRYHRGNLDLEDVLAYYGATRPYTLDFWCRRLGIPSPKENGDGRDVERRWNEARFGEICTYLEGDLRATAALLEYGERANVIEGPRNVRVVSDDEPAT